MGGVHTYVKNVNNFGPSSTVSEETGIRKTFGHNVQCAPSILGLRRKTILPISSKTLKEGKQIAVKLIFGCFPTSNRVKRR